jgi:hypothetical protein
VVPPPSPTGKPPSLSVSDTTPFPFEIVQVTGRNFDPSQKYEIDFAQGTSVTRLSGPSSPRGNGDVSVSVMIPLSARPGPATVVGCVVTSQGETNRCGQVTITVRG